MHTEGIYSSLSPPIPLMSVFEDEEGFNSRKSSCPDTPNGLRNLSIDMSFDKSLTNIRMASTSKYITPKREHRFDAKREVLLNFIKTDLAKPMFDNDWDCYSNWERWKSLKNNTNCEIFPIPMSFNDYSDAYFFDEQTQRRTWHFVYQRQRPDNFLQLIRNIKNPSWVTYNQQLLKKLWPIHKAQIDCEKDHADKNQQFQFNAIFESGNLDKAIQISENEYNLFLQADTNTRGHTQWFYFSVQNRKKDKTIKLNIMNFAKNGSLFIRGMTPCVYSEMRNKKFGYRWTRGGFDVTYTGNSIQRNPKNRMMSHFFTLSFSYTFQYDNDKVFFAFSEPYGYTNLCQMLSNLNAHYTAELTQSELCKSLGGLKVPMLEIGSKAKAENRKLVVITARVHPGETTGSWMVEGLIKWLISNDESAFELRRRCIIKIIPMLNPDGVLAGNYRTSLAGTDLNRKWTEPDPSLYPTIFHAKKLAQSADVYIDLHGHSKKDGYFMYGNRVPRRDPNYWTTKFLPTLLSKLNPCFLLQNTRFVQNEGNTARAVLNRLGTLHSFTLEASFHGWVVEGESKWFMGPIHRNMGQILGQGISDLINQIVGARQSLRNANFQSVTELTNKLKDNFRKKLVRMKANEQAKKLKEKRAQERVPTPPPSDSESSASDSDPSEDNLEQDELEKIHTTIRKSRFKLVKRARETRVFGAPVPVRVESRVYSTQPDDIDIIFKRIASKGRSRMNFSPKNSMMSMLNTRRHIKPISANLPVVNSIVSQDSSGNFQASTTLGNFGNITSMENIGITGPIGSMGIQEQPMRHRSGMRNVGNITSMGKIGTLGGRHSSLPPLFDK